MAEPRARLYVLAGVNGAGKSSIGGAMLRLRGGDYFNPDEAAAAIVARNPGSRIEDANSSAWQQGKRLLERSIAEHLVFAFETTLGGKTITSLLAQAADRGADVRIWYVGLETAELHIARVRARVLRGGHDIPDSVIRRRYDASRSNLIHLLPKLEELRLYDNSAHADPHRGVAPAPRLVLHCKGGRIRGPADLAATPTWARPIVAAAMQIFTRPRGRS